jgi:outer membrane protein TolC
MGNKNKRRVCLKRPHGGGFQRLLPWLLALTCLPAAAAAHAQTAGASGVVPANGQAAQSGRVITLDDALRMARANSPEFQAAVAAGGAARAARLSAQSVLLPNLNLLNAYTYTESNAAGEVRFVANNAPREYLSQVDVHDEFGLAQAATYRSAAAAETGARAEVETASRVLVVTVGTRYDALVAA